MGLKEELVQLMKGKGKEANEEPWFYIFTTRHYSITEQNLNLKFKNKGF